MAPHSPIARTGGQPPPVPQAATAAPPSDVAELRTNALGDSGRGQIILDARHIACVLGKVVYQPITGVRGLVVYGLMPNMLPWVRWHGCHADGAGGQ
jgi:hypothetical protein